MQAVFDNAVRPKAFDVFKQKGVKVAILSVAVSLLSSCATIKQTPKVNYFYPDEIKTICHQQRNIAKAQLEQTGMRLEEKASCIVILVPGQKMSNGRWAWRAPEMDFRWVYGTITEFGNTYVINIGCNPTNKSDISKAALIHENAHFWLMSNKGVYGHPKAYTNLFLNWFDPPDKP